MGKIFFNYDYLFVFCKFLNKKKFSERKVGRICPRISVDERISFYAKISLKDCSNKNLIAVSVGIYGYNTVSAIFVTPLCGCDCENPRFQVFFFIKKNKI